MLGKETHFFFLELSLENIIWWNAKWHTRISSKYTWCFNQWDTSKEKCILITKFSKNVDSLLGGWLHSPEIHPYP